MTSTNDTAAGPQRMFPIQSERGAKPHPLRIPWDIAELAYSVYSARYGRSQSLADLARRGGFGPGEMDDFLPGWREQCAGRASRDEEIAALSQFKTAVIEAAVVDGTYKHEHETDARKAVNDLLCHAQKIALDPLVSPEARAMVERAEKAESQVKRLEERVKELEDALRRISDLSLMPDDWKYCDVWGDYTNYKTVRDGAIEEVTGDDHEHGWECGLWTAAKMARAALSGGPGTADPTRDGKGDGGGVTGAQP